MSSTGPSTPTFRDAEAVFAPLDAALVAPLPLARGDRAADIGPGGGVVTLMLAERVGSTGRVYAVDSDPEMLSAVRESARAAGLDDRVRTLQHDLDDGPPLLPELVSLVWSAACVHHALDVAAAVRGLSGLLTPGGTLALGEGGLPTRCLPWDVGLGRPGLEVRLDAAHTLPTTFGSPGGTRAGRGSSAKLAAGRTSCGSLGSSR